MWTGRGYKLGEEQEQQPCCSEAEAAALDNLLIGGHPSGEVPPHGSDMVLGPGLL